MAANWRRCAAELLGTFVLVFGGTTAIVAPIRADAPVLVVVPFAFGLALLAGLYALRRGVGWPPLGAALAWAIHAGVVRGAEAAAPEPAAAVAEACGNRPPSRRLTSRKEARTLAACRCPRWSRWASERRSSG